jgi:hypothetical protein
MNFLPPSPATPTGPDTPPPPPPPSAATAPTYPSDLLVHAQPYEYTAYDFVSEQTRRWRLDRFAAPPPARATTNSQFKLTITADGAGITRAGPNHALDPNALRRGEQGGMRIKAVDAEGNVSFDTNSGVDLLPKTAASAPAAPAAAASSSATASAPKPSDKPTLIWSIEDVLAPSTAVEKKIGLIDALAASHTPETIIYTCKTPLKKPVLMFETS